MAANPYLQHLEPEENGNSANANPYTGKQFSARYFKILETRKTLPVYERRDELVEMTEESKVVVLVGETGSGKTTQVPQFLVDAGYAKDGMMVACTQPRRVAAMSVAKRVAEEMDVVLGQEVGYTIRFEDKTSQRTMLKYCTDGMLLREAMHDPDLLRYRCIVLDEAHERTLATDLLMGLLKGVITTRKSPINMVVMSATLDAEKFVKYFEGAPLLQVPGRMFPVGIFYLPEPAKDYFEHAISTAVHIHQNEEPGDVLCFLTGEEEIEEGVRRVTEEMVGTEKTLGPLKVLPLYASLPPERQQRVFDPAPSSDIPGISGRKIIFATNIAETSLTIDGVVYVIDSGFSKQKTYNPRVRSEALQVTPISRASAKQRTGRAGRTRPGKCFRLYTEKAFKNDLIETSFPEIQRSNICNLVLQMKTLGIENLVYFDFMDPPAPETMMRALEQLHYLGALSDEGELSDLGYKMAEFPLEPELSKMLISAPKFGCSNEAVSIAAMLSAAGNAFLRPSGRQDEADEAKAKFQHPDGDHGTLLNVYHSFKQHNEDQNWCFENYLNGRALRSADNVRSQLERIMVKLDLDLVSVDYSDPNHFHYIARTIVSGYFMQAAYADRAAYLTVKDNQLVQIHPSSVLMAKKPKCLIFNEFVLTSKNYIRTLTNVRVEWLLDIAPHYYNPADMPKDSKIRLELERLIRQRESRKRARE
mmetsp:Transcript_29829/g.114543  ORF Transcript_29829/g.114543 Transcript_29829/m.114543 type:complete len:702 (-) Transcript_29829:405-2510(-)